MRKIIVFPGQKVQTTSGKVVVVAFVNCGQVYAFGKNGLLEVVDVVTDAWGS